MTSGAFQGEQGPPSVGRVRGAEVGTAPSMELGRPLRAAIAAGLSWVVVLPMGGVADEYPYYAPLGAVVAVTASVIGSVRESLQTIAAMAIGVALAVLTTPLPQLLSLLVVVALGTGVAVSPLFERLGSAASWTPVTGMFVLVIGGDSPWEYAGAYLGLTTFGALVGLVVNLVWPPFPLHAHARALARVRGTLAGQLESVSEGLSGDRPPTPEEWEERTADLDALVHEMRAVASDAGDSRRANWRVRRWRTDAEKRYLQARALERLAFLVEDLTDLLQEQEHDEREHVALGRSLRPYAARALADLAGVLRSAEDDGEVEPELVERADTSVEALVRAMRGVRRVTGDDLITAGGVVTVVGRTLSSVAQPVRPGG